MVITRAIGRHLRSYPHARFPDHEDLLRHPLLDDHLSRQGNSEAYPRGGVCDFELNALKLDMRMLDHIYRHVGLDWTLGNFNFFARTKTLIFDC